MNPASSRGKRRKDPGLEEEHYEISMKIGSQRLFPAVEGAATDEIIDGFSCRH